MAGAGTQSPEDAVAHLLGLSRKPAHLLVAVSGGSDSVGLLVMLADRARAFPEITLSAATIDHGLRDDARAEAIEVAALCARFGIAHVIRRWEGDKPATGIMAAAREARYQLLADAAADLGADVIVTGHTYDDQQETLSMRGARVADGDDSIATGIADAVLFDRCIWVLRPLLSCRRADIRSVLSDRGMTWIDDPSNDDTHYERVRTRQVLAERPVRVMTGGEAARNALSKAAADWLQSHVAIHAGVLAAVQTAGLDADIAVFGYALSNLTAAFGGKPFGPGRERLQRILAFIAARQPGRRTAGGVVFDLRSSGLYLMRESRGIGPLTVEAGERAVWDGRFAVINGSAGAVRVEATGAHGRAALSEDLPNAAVQRAGAVLPRVTGAGAEGAMDLPAGVEFHPYIAPFDRFLTRYDLIFADQLALAFGRKPFLPLPLSGLLTENASLGVDCLGKGPA